MKKAFVFSLILGVLQAIGAVVAWQFMPELLPANWGIGGEVTSWTGRWILFLPSGLTILVSILLYFLPKVEPKGEDAIKRSGKGYPLVMLLVALLMLVIQIVIILAGLGREVAVHIIVPIAIGVLLVVLGNYLPQAKQNYFYGIRLPWTLASEEVWTKTHRIGGKIFVVIGLLFIGGAFLPTPWNFVIPLAGLTVGLIYLTIYSCREFKRLEK